MSSIDDAKSAYNAATPPPLFRMDVIAAEVNSGAGNNTFSNFNCLQYPLNQCESIGIGMMTMREYTRPPDKPVRVMGGFSENDEEDSSSSSSSSSDSENSTSSDDSNSKKKKPSAMKKVPPPAKKKPSAPVEVKVVAPTNAE